MHEHSTDQCVTIHALSGHLRVHLPARTLVDGTWTAELISDRRPECPFQRPFRPRRLFHPLVAEVLAGIK
jgi:hypothetical protein